jgi:hypothetical protein
MSNVSSPSSSAPSPQWAQDCKHTRNARGQRSNIRAVTGQYLAEKQYSLLIPLYILALYWVISALIVLLMGIKMGLPLPAAMQQDNASSNFGSVTSFPGFLIVVGALCANRQFGAALAFGSTRRGFWLGTMLGFLETSLATGLFTLAALACEMLSHHWWFGVHAFDVTILGSGNYGIAFLVVFSMSMMSLLAGATFGTIFRSFGQMVLTWSLIATAVVLVALFAVVIWKSDPVIRFFTPWGCWTLIAGTGLLALVLAFVGYFVNQRATI